MHSLSFLTTHKTGATMAVVANSPVLSAAISSTLQAARALVPARPTHSPLCCPRGKSRRPRGTRPLERMPSPVCFDPSLISCYFPVVVRILRLSPLITLSLVKKNDNLQLQQQTRNTNWIVGKMKKLRSGSPSAQEQAPSAETNLFISVVVHPTRKDAVDAMTMFQAMLRNKGIANILNVDVEAAGLCNSIAIFTNW
eukprot:TRINITY_DN4322_c0_g1_i4.p1 TRINITY_DN4322_c0_g1~~TRINITY_DN4322_c0_g1_i4.p1  ORF type:complete len:197 (-),score=31.53 TRINITY_DN4322_c0_g1_i4:90-680(-)